MSLNIKEVRPYGLRRHRDSLTVFNREIASRPNHAPAYYNKGSLMFDLGRFEKALVSLESPGFRSKLPLISCKISLTYGICTGAIIRIAVNMDNSR